MARFVTEVSMRWSDMDAYRHINNAAYVTYLEDVRTALFRSREGYRATTVISRAEIDYVRPVVYRGRPLRAEAWIADLGAASFLLRYELFDGQHLAVRANTTCVAYDLERNTLRRFTTEEKAALQPLLESA
jgi:acyl-CoA thioester hydrolase